MPKEDASLDRLLVLDGEIMDVGGGHWVKIEARRVSAATARPYGVKYSLCLFAPDDRRVVCFDNAHPVAVGKGPARKKTIIADHFHKDGKIAVYAYTDAETLLVDFWDAVDAYLKKAGVP
jgi:hypothetical protein